MGYSQILRVGMVLKEGSEWEEARGLGAGCQQEAGKVGAKHSCRARG